MIFVFLDDNSLDIINDSNDAKREYEGIDVEAGTYQFFNENGISLNPIFSKPTKHYKELFGLFHSVQSGEYDLIVSNDIDNNLFQKKLLKVEFLNENKWFKSLDEIREKYIV